MNGQGHLKLGDSLDLHRDSRCTNNFCLFVTILFVWCDNSKRFLWPIFSDIGRYIFWFSRLFLVAIWSENPSIVKYSTSPHNALIFWFKITYYHGERIITCIEPDVWPVDNHKFILFLLYFILAVMMLLKKLTGLVGMQMTSGYDPIAKLNSNC